MEIHRRLLTLLKISFHWPRELFLCVEVALRDGIDCVCVSV